MIFCGIDPGSLGAIAFVDYEKFKIDFYALPYVDKELDVIAFATILNYYKITTCCLEHCQSTPVMSKVGTFSFGKGFGAVKATLALMQISYQEIRPQVWKKEFGLISKGKKTKKEKKEASVVVANRLFPEAELSLDQDGEAEALLMAEYAKRKFDFKK